MRIFANLSIINVGTINLSILPFADNLLNKLGTNDGQYSVSGDWEEMSKLFQNIDSHNFRRKRPIVGIMGAGLSERYSRSPFLDEMQSCIVGSSLLCRFSETPLGNPLLNIDYPLMSGISINHLWYWYKLLPTKPSLRQPFRSD